MSQKVHPQYLAQIPHTNTQNITQINCLRQNHKQELAKKMDIRFRLKQGHLRFPLRPLPSLCPVLLIHCTNALEVWNSFTVFDYFSFLGIKTA